MNFIDIAKQNQDFCIKLRRDLHQIPELELNLPETAAYVKKVLDEIGISYKTYIDGNGISAVVNEDSNGSCIAVRADMDALEIKEETGLEFCSKYKGRMHACGHDGHMAIALTVLKIVNEYKKELNGKVKFIFQPGEEIPGGAEPMIKHGVLENPKVDFIIGLHEGRISPELKDGAIGFKNGAAMAAMDKFTLTVCGKGGHGANPQETIDPIVISAHIINAVQSIISRKISPNSKALISICKINGGTSQNIIPDSVEMVGTVRTVDKKVQDYIEKLLFEIPEGIAKSYGGHVKLNYERKYPVLINEEKLTQEMYEISKSLFPDDTMAIKEPLMGGEDMAFYNEKVPGCYFYLSNMMKNKDDGQIYPHHSSKFDVDEQQFYKGIAVFLAAIYKKLA